MRIADAWAIAKIAFMAVAIFVMHVGLSIVVKFLIELDSFPYGMQRSQDSIYLNSLEFMNRLLGLPLDFNRASSRHGIGQILINSLVIAGVATVAIIGFSKAKAWKFFSTPSRS